MKHQDNEDKVKEFFNEYDREAMNVFSELHNKNQVSRNIILDKSTGFPRNDIKAGLNVP